MCVCVAPMTATVPLMPQITCRFWQALYSLRPQVGPIGGLHQVTPPGPPHRRRVVVTYDTDVEDDLQYGLRNKYAWVWRPLEETGTPDYDHDLLRHLDPSDPILDFLGDHDLSDSDDADDSLEVVAVIPAR